MTLPTADEAHCEPPAPSRRPRLLKWGGIAVVVVLVVMAALLVGMPAKDTKGVSCDLHFGTLNVTIATIGNVTSEQSYLYWKCGQTFDVLLLDDLWGMPVVPAALGGDRGYYLYRSTDDGDLEYKVEYETKDQALLLSFVNGTSYTLEEDTVVLVSAAPWNRGHPIVQVQTLRMDVPSIERPAELRSFIETDDNIALFIANTIASATLWLNTTGNSTV